MPTTTAHKPGTIELAIIVMVGVIALTGFAYLVMVMYDIPVRRYLMAKRMNRVRAESAPVKS